MTIAQDRVAVAERIEAEPAKPTEKRLYVLDLFRFAAAMFVVGYHMLGFMPPKAGSGALVDLVDRFFGYGWMGVELFFIISGFVICMSSWGRSLSQFFVSRVSRLLPAYVFAVLVTSAVLILFGPKSGGPSLNEVLGNLTMVPNLLKIPNIDRSYWTLLVELKFYLIFAVVVWFGVTYRRVVLFCLVWTVAALLAQAAGDRLWITILEPVYMPCFVVGIALYLIHRFGSNTLLWGIVAGNVVLGLISLRVRLDSFGPEHHLSAKVAYPLLIIFYVIMAAAALGWFSWVRWRGLVTIGALTYPLYLLHQQNSRVFMVHLRDVLPYSLLIGCAVAGSLLAAYLVYRLVEGPISALLRRGLTASFAQVRASAGEQR